MSEKKRGKGVTGNQVFLTLFIAAVVLPVLYVAARSVVPGIFHDTWLRVRSPESLVQASRLIGECRNRWIAADSLSSWGSEPSLNAQSRYERQRLRTIASMEGLQEVIEQRLDKQMLGSARSVIADVERAYEEGFAGKSYIGDVGSYEACHALGRKRPYDVKYR